MSSKKAFTLVEIMIVIVIIGLVAAMAIPAYQKIKGDSRKPKAYVGNVLPRSEVSEPAVTKEPTTNAAGFQTLVVDGVVYYVVPKQDYPKEVEIGGSKYWLIPSKR